MSDKKCKYVLFESESESESSENDSKSLHATLNDMILGKRWLVGKPQKGKPIRSVTFVGSILNPVFDSEEESNCKKTACKKTVTKK